MLVDHYMNERFNLLRNKHLGGAGLDVVEGEQLKKSSII